MENMPDVAPTLMAMAPLVPGGLELVGLSTLRIKECDRSGVPASHPRSLGISVTEGPDWIKIGELENQPSDEVTLNSYDDHRIAMSFAVLASKIGGIRILDPRCVGKTFPSFWNELKRFGAKVTFGR